MERLPSLRASDSDREHVAERLRLATAEGRLTADELEERLETLYSARTYGELDSLTDDLPVPSRPAQRGIALPRWAGPAAAVTAMLTLISMLAGLHHSVAEGAGGADRPGGVRFDEVHHGFVVAASMVGMMALLGICALVVWLALETRDGADGSGGD